MINVLFSGNSKVLDGVLTCMLSIFKRSDTKEPFRFYIYTMDITRIKPEYTAIRQEEVARWEELSIEEHMDFYLAQDIEKREAMKRVAKDRGVSKRDVYSQLLG